MTRSGESATVRRRTAITRIEAVGQAATDGSLADIRGAMAELDRLAEEFADDLPVRTLAEVTRSALGFFVGSPGSDVSRLREAMASFGELAEAVPGAVPAAAPMLGLLPDYLDALQAHQDDDSATFRAVFSQVLARSGDLSPGDPLRAAMADVAPLLDAMYAAQNGAEPQVPLAPPGATDAVRALHLATRGGLAMRWGAEQDLDRINTGIDDLRSAIRLTPEHHPYHVFFLTTLALGLTQRSSVRGSLADVDEGIRVLERARELAGGPDHPHWSFANQLLTRLHTRRGAAAPARRVGLEGLRGYTWQVLVQPDPVTARAFARNAAEEAIEIAGRCLADHQPADAVRALDAGRGLMLFAATELRDPCTRLAEAGHRDLADQWRTAEQPSTRLRERVLAVLTRVGGLLDPPDLDEIQNALRRLGADALVYLVPASPPEPGWAVIAPAEGAPRYLALPHLAIEKGTDVERYLTALTTRDAGLVREVGPIDRDGFTDRLDALCGWAWTAAMGPLVTPYLNGERVPRLVLIPMGDLARVPWQAACDPNGTYAVQRVALSQAASARMLCDSATAEPVRVAPSGLVLADPDTGGRAVDLRAARLEAYAIHKVFYPAASYLGRRPDGNVSSSGAGTPDDVRSWLRADGAAAGTMLHFASHGVIETARATASSRLLLAGGDLTADELIGVMAEAGRHPIALVVLAACHTGESIHGYDEAYSLATMFLAAGARSVLSTRWSVPDQETSLLMYMFHHFLMAERRPPWDALRRAQMWMLDGERRPPRHMPLPLRRMLDDTDPARVVSWAGFAHWGH